MRIRRLARNLSLRRRFLAVTANERMLFKSLLKAYIEVGLRLRLFPLSKEAREHAENFGAIVLMCMFSIIVEPVVELDPLVHHQRTIESFSESECWNFFETRKEDLPRLLVVLRIPEQVKLVNGSKMSGEELLLRGLYELVSGNDQHDIIIVFGGEQTKQSRAFTWFIDHIYATFLDLVTDNLQWWYENGHLHRSMEAIKSKMDGADAFDVCGFIDCNCLTCNRPGGGPTCEGPDAERWDPLIQKSFYNGWKSTHGLKHQTFDIAYGMTVDLYGPHSLRRNDLALLRMSRLNVRLRDLQEGQDIQLKAYGDSIYPRLSHLSTSWRTRGEVLAPWQRFENKAFTKVRISIEWNYMVTANLYGYLRREHKLKILSEGRVHKVYTVATILRNCHVALYGSETSLYFNIVLPDDFLEQYMRVGVYE